MPTLKDLGISDKPCKEVIQLQLWLPRDLFRDGGLRCGTLRFAFSFLSIIRVNYTGLLATRQENACIDHDTVGIRPSVQSISCVTQN